MTRLAKQTRYDSNRKDFSEKLDAGTRGQRGGLFSLPLGLTIGDASTNYQRDRKPAELVGKTKGFSNSRGKSTTAEPFNKLQSNAIGDEYQDAGRYFLRTTAGTKKLGGAFVSSGNGKLTKHSEFLHMKEYNNHVAGPAEKSFKQAAIRTTSGSFQKMIPYIEDAYERKEDMRRLDYQRRAALILDK
jgi:hypothetical protein